MAGIHIHDIFEFHLTFPNGDEVQVYPKNNQIEFQWTKFDERWGFFRRHCETELIFYNDPRDSIADFDTLLAFERSDDRCEFVLIDIYRICDEIETLEWSGRLRMTDGDWDLSYCEVKIKPEVVDEYTCLLDHWEEEIDFSVLASSTITIAPLFNVETQECVVETVDLSTTESLSGLIETLNTNTGSDAFRESLRAILLLTVFQECPSYLDAGTLAWSLLSAEDNSTSVFFGSFRFVIVREYETGTCSPDPVAPDSDPAWILLEDNCPTDSLWVRKITSGIIYDGAIGTINTPIHLAYPLAVIGYLFVDCNIPIISNFFNINPDATEPDNIAYTKAAEFLTAVHIVHVSDFIKDDEDGADTHAVIPFSLKAILESLPGNIDIVMDTAANALRIEHVSYFRRIKMLDLTDADHVFLINGNYKYGYNKEKMPKQEKFSWKALTDGVGNDFDGLPIIYNSACVDPNTKERTIGFPIFYSNVKYLFEHKADFQSNLDGLIILSTKDLKVMYDTCPISGEVKLNGHFAMSTQHENYWKWDRPLPGGVMNVVETQFFRWLRQKVQDDVQARFCCDDIATFNPDHLIKTQLGWGEVKEARLIEPSSTFTFDILHY